MSSNTAQVTRLSSSIIPTLIPRGARICVINIMDNAAGTKRHFERTILAADPNAKITWCRMQCTKIDSKYFREQDFLLSDDFTDWQNEIGINDFDHVIFTGINRGNLSYEDLARDYPDFWQESRELARAIPKSIRSGKTGHATFVCWSAFALMKELYGVEKGIHEEKFYGLFPHKIVCPPHPLVVGLGQDDILVPQSRFSYMNEGDLKQVISNHDGEIVMNGPGGPAIWTLEGGRISCFINHLEYSLETLNNEYLYGLSKNNGVFPAPQNYNYDPQKENPELSAIFERLNAACSIFYKNLIKLAKAQKTMADNALLLEEPQTTPRKLAFGS